MAGLGKARSGRKPDAFAPTILHVSALVVRTDADRLSRRGLVAMFVTVSGICSLTESRAPHPPSHGNPDQSRAAAASVMLAKRLFSITLSVMGGSPTFSAHASETANMLSLIHI
jgi:hypothetical protein